MSESTAIYGSYSLTINSVPNPDVSLINWGDGYWVGTPADGGPVGNRDTSDANAVLYYFIAPRSLPLANT
ncbi:hypothetical protein V1290_002543 [Bradyrhizobium sp. AZCC 1578]